MSVRDRTHSGFVDADGKVRNGDNIVTDPNQAENIIVEGHYTIDQVKAMAKAGNIHSLSYDVAT
ncbi:MAG: hypothetical protein II767_05105, partial [Proteobacteria bacterium]|nr:hypothetical protein [Pseudomonadota bacterium]